jgi:prepilin-type N-terminal cleavage/methylation domain-containing protein
MTSSFEKARERSESQSGFTLIEALIAIVILAFGLIAVTNLLVVAAASNQIGNMSTATASEASETLERLKAVTFNTLAPGGDLAADSGAANPVPVPPAQPDIFVGGALTYHMYRDLPGVGTVRTRWVIVNPVALTATRFITVESQVIGPFGGQLSRAQFSAFRACTGNGCP